jgi:hypothetical protein
MQVHYNGWDEKWDEWLSADGLMKLPNGAPNCQYLNSATMVVDLIGATSICLFGAVDILSNNLEPVAPSVDISSLDEQAAVEGHKFHVVSARNDR